MHDKNGKLLKVGDRVVIEFLIKEIYSSENYCNCRLESLEGMPPTGDKMNISAVNTKQTILIEE